MNMVEKATIHLDFVVLAIILLMIACAFDGLAYYLNEMRMQQHAMLFLFLMVVAIIASFHRKISAALINRLKEALKEK